MQRNDDDFCCYHIAHGTTQRRRHATMAVSVDEAVVASKKPLATFHVRQWLDSSRLPLVCSLALPSSLHTLASYLHYMQPGRTRLMPPRREMFVYSSSSSSGSACLTRFTRTICTARNKGWYKASRLAGSRGQRVFQPPSTIARSTPTGTFHLSTWARAMRSSRSNRSSTHRFGSGRVYND